MAAALLLMIVLQSSGGPDAQIVELHRAYEQSCLQRDYGSFDEVCNQISDEIRAYERAHPPPPPPARAQPSPPGSAPTSVGPPQAGANPINPVAGR